MLRPLLRWHLTHSARISSGFSRDDEWGYRALEPSRCCISSISLVLLNTGIEHGSSRHDTKAADSETDSEDEDLKAKTTMGDVKVTLDDQQMNTAQKLLLFWRKPAVSASDILVRRVCSDVMIAAKMLVGWRRSGYSRGRGFQGECKDQSLGETGVDARVELGMSSGVGLRIMADLCCDSPDLDQRSRLCLTFRFCASLRPPPLHRLYTGLVATMYDIL